MHKVVILDHPLIQHKMAKIRDKNTGTKDFRESVSEISGLITYEITRDLETVPKEIETPITPMIANVLKRQVVIVPILKAGLRMVEGIQTIIATAKIGHIGLYREEETLEPKVYCAKFPKGIEFSVVILVDPLLAPPASGSNAFA